MHRRARARTSDGDADADATQLPLWSPTMTVSVSPRRYQKKRTSAKTPHAAYATPTALLLSLLLATLLLVLTAHRARDALPAVRGRSSGAISEFSAETAVDHLRAITTTQHPYASREVDRVSRYVVEELVKMRVASKHQQQHQQKLERQQQQQQHDLFDIVVDDPALALVAPAHVRYSGGVNATVRNPIPRRPLAPTIVHFQSKNVYARLRRTTLSENTHRRDVNNTNALLIAAHLDSTVTSRGAFDDGIGIASMLEIIRALLVVDHITPTPAATAAPQQARQQHRPFDIVFLFGNGEELGLLDAHAHVQSALWPGTRAFVNVEAGGSGRRAMLFRSAASGLVELYGRVVPRPHVNVIAGDVFKLGLIPSDTNFRVWAMERSVPGIDIAFGENRFFYHTPKDNMDLVVGGEVQHLGDNLLHLVRAMLREDYLANEENNDARSHVLVYFDVLGKAFVSMTGGIYVVVLVLVLVVEIGVLASHKSEIRTLLGATSDYLAGTAIGIAWTAGFALLLHQLNPAVVGAHPWLVMSAIACFTLLGHLIRQSTSALTPRILHAASLPVWTLVIILILTTPARHYGGLYLFPVWAAFLAVGASVSRVVYTPIAVHFLVFTAIPIMLTWDVTVLVARGLAPTVVDGKPGWPVIAMLQFVCILLSGAVWPALRVVAGSSPIERRRLQWIFTAVAIGITAFCVLYPPMQEQTPGRVWIEAMVNVTNTTTDHPVLMTIRTGHDVKRITGIVADVARSSNHNVDILSTDCDEPDAPRYRGLWRTCHVELSGVHLFPRVNLAQFQVNVGTWQRVNDTAWTLDGTVHVPAQSQIVVMELTLGEGSPDDTLLLGGFFDEPDVREVTNASLPLVLSYLRYAPASEAAWTLGFQLEVQYSSAPPSSHMVPPRIDAALRCLIDDLAEEVPFMAQLIDRLPPWLMPMSTGAGMGSIHRQLQIGDVQQR